MDIIIKDKTFHAVLTFTVMRSIVIIDVQKDTSLTTAFMKTQKINSTETDYREYLLVEEAYLMYLNNYLFDTGRIPKKDHDHMIRQIKSRTYILEKIPRQSI